MIGNQQEFARDGFTVIDDLYSVGDINAILSVITSADKSKDTFRKTNDLFAIRQFLKELPAVVPLIFNKRLKVLIRKLIGDGYFVSKSIYFDKPASSNWFVHGIRI